MTLLHPGWLLLALAVPAIWLFPRRLRDVRLGLLRSLVLALVALGAARPVAWTEDASPWHVVVVDVGDSVAASAQDAAAERARAIAAALPGDARAVLVSCGKAVDGAGFDHVVRVSGQQIARALEAAARAIPAGARGSVTVLSAGLADERDWARATQQLTARGIPVHAITLPLREPTAAIVGLDVPETLRVGAIARFGVRLRGRGTTVTLRLRLSGEEGFVQEATVESVVLAGVQVATIELEPQQAGFFEARVELEVTAGTDDPEPPADNVLTQRVAVQDPLRLLYVGKRMAEGGPRLAELLGAGFDFVPAEAGRVAAQLAQADLVVVDDAPADTIPVAAQAAIRAAVQDGTTGLVMAGGRASFGAGGWQRSPLADALPIEMVQKEEKRDPSTTLVVIIDTSGSMGGNRVQLAKEVARLAIRRLLPHDKVGIVEFYGAKRWAAPIQPASNAIEIQRALNRLNAGGGTVIMPAIEEAFYGLQNVQTRYKHVLVLTDGGVETGAFEPLLRRMAEKGITVSSVLIGGQTHSEFLVNLANWGKGRFYGVPNRFNLPEILLKQPASAHLPAWRAGNHVLTAKGGAGWWGDITDEAIPPLAGYVEARARPGATTLLEVSTTKHPVLATWRFGLGRATALLTEPTGPGTAPWTAWEGYGAALARVLARTASDARRPYRFHAEQRDGVPIIVAHQLRADAPPPEGELVAFDRELVFRRRAPDRYETAPIHRYLALTGALVGARGEPPERLVLLSPSRRAHQREPEEALDLEQFAASTGGRALDLAASSGFVPTAGGGDKPVDVVPLWPWCLLLALLVWLGELLYRRLPRSGGARS